MPWAESGATAADFNSSWATEADRGGSFGWPQGPPFCFRVKPMCGALSGFVPFATLSKGLGDGLDVLPDGLHVGLPPRDLSLRRGIVNLDHHLSVQLEPLDVAPAPLT